MALASGTLAQDFPTRPVHLVVPFPAGSTTDQLARPLAQRLSDVWKQPVIVDNRAGAGGIIGAQLVANAPADGYTLLFGSNGINAINAAVHSHLPYDPLKSFEPVTQVSTSSLVLVVNPSVRAQTVSELIALAKSKPGQLTFGSGGNGTTPHLAGELFNTMAGVKLLHVPYKGSPQSVIDLVAGRLDVIFANTAGVLEHVRAGQLRVLGVTSRERDPMMPTVPTLSESGVPGFEVEVWTGIFAPAGTPPRIVDALNQQIRIVLAREDIVRQFAALGFTTETSAPRAFAGYVHDEVAKWAGVVKVSGAKVD
jgi:tripartite-type tricarboxylate transporter receptor subunit TctC